MRKVSVDLEQLGQVLAETTVLQQAATEQAAKIARRTVGDMEERLKKSGLFSLDDIEDLLEYEYDSEGNRKSKISENARLKYNLRLLESHPEVMRQRTPHAAPAVFNVHLNEQTLMIESQARGEVETRHLQQLKQAKLPLAPPEVEGE